MRIFLNKKQYEVLLDEFLLSPELQQYSRRWSHTHNYNLKRRCFDYALNDEPIGLISNQSEYAITVMAKFFLAGHQLGLDIDSGVSKRYKEMKEPPLPKKPKR